MAGPAWLCVDCEEDCDPRAAPREKRLTREMRLEKRPSVATINVTRINAHTGRAADALRRHPAFDDVGSVARKAVLGSRGGIDTLSRWSERAGVGNVGERHRFPPDSRCRFVMSKTCWPNAASTCRTRLRRWFLKFGRLIAGNLQRSRPRPSSYWHLDERVIKIRGRKHWLWRAVDDKGEVLDLLVQPRRCA